MTSYTTGMPDELVREDDAKESSKGSLSNSYVLIVNVIYFIIIYLYF